MRKDYQLIVALLICIAVSLTVFAGAVPEKPDEQQQFTFAIFGDNRPNRHDLPQPDTFKTILKEIDALNPAFTINVGDCIYGSRDFTQMQEQYKDYTDTIKSLLKAKVYLVIGNHEIQGSKVNQDFFRKETGELYYSFDYGNAHFIVLSSEVVGEEGRIANDQLKWLKQDLHKSRAARHKFVFVHRPMYPISGHIGKCLDTYPKERDALNSLFSRYRITAVFAGHEHLYNEEIRSGVRYIITGGGGAMLYPSLLGTGDFHHFVVVSVDGDKVEMKMIKPALNGRPQEVIPIGGKQ